MREVCGISFKELGEATRAALEEHALPDDGVTFDLPSAGDFRATSDKGYSARASADILNHEWPMSHPLTIVVFAPGDGTGDESTFNLHDIDTGEYPHQTQVLPRSKERTDAEIAIPLFSVRIDNTQPSPVLHAGNLDLLTVKEGENALKRFGVIGQQRPTYQDIMAGLDFASPNATYTVGSNLKGGDSTNYAARFGDPHAVYNPHPGDIQVVAFVPVFTGISRINLQNTFQPSHP